MTIRHGASASTRAGFSLLLAKAQALCAALVLVTWVSAGYAREMVSVDRAQINMRAGAGTQHAQLWTLSRGYPLEVTAHQGQWLKVRDFEKDTGWVYRPLVNKTPHVIVKSPVARVRRAPSTRSAIVGKAAYGEVLRHLEHRSGWIKVQRDDGLKGWVARQLLWGW